MKPDSENENLRDQEKWLHFMYKSYKVHGGNFGACNSYLEELQFIGVAVGDEEGDA